MRFRVLIFISLTCIVVLPVIILTTWVVSDTLKRENDIIKEKHLILAKYLSKTLEQYSSNLRNSFDVVANLRRQKQLQGLPKDYALWQKFDYFCVMNLKNGEMISAIAQQNISCAEQLPVELIEKFTNLVEDGKTVFSPVLKNPKGDPRFYLLRAYGTELLIGAVSTEYIVAQGAALSFGDKGHAAIVDQTGGVISHPRNAWRQSIKNLINVAPVARMVAKETGTTTFYSPALNAQMVTGYTYVPSTGWGVMVPQPLAEIRADTIKVRNALIGISLAGLIAAGLLSWFLSGYLTRTLSSIIQMSKDMAEGDLDARIEMGSGLRPREIDELSVAFNAMAKAIKARDAELDAKSTKLQSSNLNLEKSAKKLERALASAEIANRSKSEFLAAMSHELRTPLTSAIGSMGLLASMTGGKLSADEQELMEIAKRNNETLLRLVNELLDYEKILSGRIELETSPCDIGALTSGVVHDSMGLARSQSVNFVFKEPSGRFFAKVHEYRFEQILNNLLSNAGKFSKAGSDVEISVESDNVNVLVRVTDHGIGIPEAFKPHIFEQFTQVDSSSTRSVGGAGLGLSISKALIEGMGGSIKFETEPNVGSTFYMVFPAHK